MKYYLAKNRHRLVTILVLYSIFILWEMFLGNYRTHSTVWLYNVIPFQNIDYFIGHHGEAGCPSFLINIVGNIVFFIPFGFLVPLVYPAWFTGLRRTLIVFVFIIFILEAMQMVCYVGVFDVDDILLNNLGVGIGYGLQKYIGRFQQH